MYKKVTLSVLALVVVGVSVWGLTRESDTPVVMKSDALLVKMNPSELVKASDVAVIGTVTDTNTRKVDSKMRPGKQDIVTDSVVHIDEYLYNPNHIASSTITIETLGGTIGNESMSVEEAASFQSGQKFVAFLKQLDPNTFEVVGWIQGKYTLGANNEVGAGDERAYAQAVFGREVTLQGVKSEISKIITQNVSQ